MIAALFLLASVALAEDPKILSVSPGETVSPTYQAYLLPEPQYNSCLTNTLNLNVCKTGLNTCHEVSQIALDDARGTIDFMQESLDAAKRQFGSDEALVQQVTDRNIQLQQENLKLRGQRNVAIALSSGMVIAAITTGYIVFHK